MQIGSFAWAEGTNGALRPGDRTAMLAPMLRAAFALAADRARLALGVRGDGGLDLDAVHPPDSKLVRLAEEESRDTQSEFVHQHGLRTYLFGLALARRDRVAADVEHLYVTSLLHDVALERPEPACCFAVRGGRTMRELALRAGCDDATATRLGEAIAMHITPGVGAELPALIQAGAMVDLTGARLWELRPEFVAAVLARHPRLGMKQRLGACWRREGEIFPAGRAAFIERWGAFTRFVGWGPFAE